MKPQDLATTLLTTDVTADRIFIPSWFLKIYDRARAQNAMNVWPHAELSFFPELSLSEIETLLYLFEPLQLAILSGRNRAEISLNNLLRHIPYTAKITRELVSRLVQMLQSLSLVQTSNESDGTKIPFLPLIENSYWLGSKAASSVTDQRTLPIFVAENFSETQKDLFSGYSTGFRRSIFETFEKTALPSEEGLWSQAPLSLCKHMWVDLAQHEKWFLLECEKATQSGSQWLSIDGHFFISVGCLDFLKSVRTTRSARSKTLPHLEGLVEKCVKKLLDHGYLEKDSERQGLALSCVKAHDFPVIVLRQCLDRSFLKSSVDHLNLYLQNISRPYFFSEGLRILQKLYNHKPSPLPEVLISDLILTPEPGLTKIEKVGRVDPLEVFIDLKLFFFTEKSERYRSPRNSDLLQWLETMVKSCELSKEGYLSFRENFSAIAIDLDQKLGSELSFLGVSILEKSSEHLKTLRENYLVRDNLPFSVSAAEQNLTPTESPSIQTATPSKQVTNSPSYSLRQVASDELDRLRANVRSQYLKVVDSYLHSLSDSRKNVVAELKKTLSQEAFESHIKQGLIRFMIENPSAWGGGSGGNSSPPQNESLTNISHRTERNSISTRTGSRL